jgi:hypothetical protein
MRLFLFFGLLVLIQGFGYDNSFWEETKLLLNKQNEWSGSKHWVVGFDNNRLRKRISMTYDNCESITGDMYVVYVRCISDFQFLHKQLR